MCVITIVRLDAELSEDNDGPGLTVFMFASNYELHIILALTMFGHSKSVCLRMSRYLPPAQSRHDLSKLYEFILTVMPGFNSHTKIRKWVSKRGLKSWRKSTGCWLMEKSSR